MHDFKVGNIVFDKNDIETAPMVIDDITNNGMLRGHYADGHGTKCFVIGSQLDPDNNLDYVRFLVYSEDGDYVGYRNTFSDARASVNEFGGSVRSGWGGLLYAVPDTPLSVCVIAEAGKVEEGVYYCDSSVRTLCSTIHWKTSNMIEYFRLKGQLIDKEDLNGIFQIDDHLTAPMLYGGNVYYKVLCRRLWSDGTEEIEVSEGHYSEDDGHFVDDGISTKLIEKDGNGKERFSQWEYRGDKAYVYPPRAFEEDSI